MKYHFKSNQALLIITASFLFFLHTPFSYSQAATEENFPEKTEEAAVEPVAEEMPASTKTVSETANDNSLLEEARSLANAGNLVDAHNSYESFLNQEGVSGALKDTAQSELEELNMKILFSPTETENSLIYTVKPGDNLYNIAKKYKTTVDLIRKSNFLKNDVIRPDMKLKISKAKFTIEVDKSDNVLQLFSDGSLLKTYRVATGTDNSTPIGQFTIDTKLENPTWYKAGAVVPPDSAENILGTRWLGFSLKGYGIHGTTMPETIGQQSSSGCIRMLNQDVEEIYSIVPIGTIVTVRD